MDFFLKIAFVVCGKECSTHGIDDSIIFDNISLSKLQSNKPGRIQYGFEIGIRFWGNKKDGILDRVPSFLYTNR